MAFLKGPFGCDAFISYAHGSGGLRDWTIAFKDRLEREMNDFHPDLDGLDIFIDQDLDRAQPLTQQLRSKVESSGLLIIVMTQLYLNSTWCRDELEWFEGQIQDKLRMGGLVLIVRAQPTDENAWPDMLKDSRGHANLGFQFHPGDPWAMDEAALSARPFGWPIPQPAHSDFYDQLAKLTARMAVQLKDINNNAALAMPAEPELHNVSEDGVFRVLLPAPRLGFGTASHIRDKFLRSVDAWRDAKQELEKVNCKVWPEVGPEIPAEGEQVSSIEYIAQERDSRRNFLRDKGHVACALRLESERLEDKVDALANDGMDLRDEGLEVPLAVIDQSGDGMPPPGLGRIEFFDAVRDGWAEDFRTWLDNTYRDAGQTA